MRSLTVEEISELERQGCSAEDWTRISVAEDFAPTHISGVKFYGDVSLGLFDKQIETDEGFLRHSAIRNAVLCDVEVGDNCLIENIGTHICRYAIGDECYIANVGLMTSNEGSTFGEGNLIPVLNEAGRGNVTIYSKASAPQAPKEPDTVLMKLAINAARPDSSMAALMAKAQAIVIRMSQLMYFVYFLGTARRASANARSQARPRRASS